MEFFRPGQGPWGQNPDVPWWRGVRWAVRNQGSWIGRAWPGTRIAVFAMGALSALNRLEAHREVMTTTPPTTTGSAADRAEPPEEEAGAGGPQPPESGQVVVGGRGGFDLDCSCRRGPRSRAAARAWAWRTDTIMCIYLALIVGQIVLAQLHEVRNPAAAALWNLAQPPLAAMATPSYGLHNIVCVRFLD
eukprot:COSAG01_NODE_776_length_13693_cov_79.900029_3_plen_190_part_00